MTRTSGAIPALIVLVLLASAVAAQDLPPAAEPPARETAPQEAGEAMILEIDPTYIDVDLGRGIIYLLGDVRARFGDLEVRCDNLIGWLADDAMKRHEDAERDPKQPVAPGVVEDLDRAAHFIREFYADGTVLLTRGGDVTRADQVYVDLEHDRGLVVNAVADMKIYPKAGESVLRLRADELRILARNRWQASDVQITTSRFAKPSYHLHVSNLEILKERPGYVEDDPDAGPVENLSFVAEGNVMHVGEIPVLWLPDFVGNTATRRPFQYIEDIRYGHSDRLGHEPGITFGDDIVLEDGSTWGHWSVPIDWYSKRGISSGVDLVYQTKDYRGYFISRYQRDEGRDDDFYGVPKTKNRGWLSWNHRHLLPGDVQLDIEGNLFSDRGYYPSYFEREYKQLKPPENLLYLKKTFFNSQVSGLLSYRFNDWLTTTEHLPELRYDLVTDPILDVFDTTLLLTSSVRVGKLRRKEDDGLSVPDRASLRADIDTLLELPVLVGPFKLTPFAGVRYTWYERQLGSHADADRFGFTFGATLSTQAWKAWDAHGGIFGLDGLRHVIMPEVTFRQTVGVDVPTTDLIPFDEVDTFDNVQVIELRVRNVLQTVRQREFGPSAEAIVDLELEVDFYPNADKDNGGDPWSNLDIDLLVRFSDDLQFVSDSEFNWYGEGFEVANLAFGFTPSPELQAYAGFRHFEDEYDAVFVQLNWRIEEKWLLSLDTSYDFNEARGIDERVTFSRIGADWVFQLSVRADLGENDFSVQIGIEPRLLFDPVLSPKSLRREPGFLYLGQGLTR